jgi:hypothetical protein
MLDKFIPVSETKNIEKPDGVAAPGEFHLRFVRREDIPAIFARAVQLGTIPANDPISQFPIPNSQFPGETARPEKAPLQTARLSL